MAAILEKCTETNVPPKRYICFEGSDGFVTSTAAPIATGWSDPVAGWELHPLKNQHLFTAHTSCVPVSSPLGRPGPNSVYFPESASTSSAWIKSSSSVGWVQKPSLSKIRSMPQFCDKTTALI